MDNYRAGGGRGFLSGPFHFLHQFQKRWSLVWSLLIRPRGVPVLPQTTLLFPALVHTHRHTNTQRRAFRHKVLMWSCCVHMYMRLRMVSDQPVAPHVYPNCYLGVSCYDNNERRASQQRKKSEGYEKELT